MFVDTLQEAKAVIWEEILLEQKQFTVSGNAALSRSCEKISDA